MPLTCMPKAETVRGDPQGSMYLHRFLTTRVHRVPSQIRFGPYFVEPIVAGLNADKKPFISAFDLIGAPVITDDFVVGGTCTNNLYGMCETLYRPDMVSYSTIAFLSVGASLNARRGPVGLRLAS